MTCGRPNFQQAQDRMLSSEQGVVAEAEFESAGKSDVNSDLENVFVF